MQNSIIMKAVLLVFLYIFFCLTGFSQSVNLGDSTFRTLTQNADVIIENEEYCVSFGGKKFGYINVHISKKITFKILNDKGLKQLSNFSLPEPFDHTYIPHAPTIRNPEFLFNEVKITNFDVVKIKPDGSNEPVNYTSTIAQKQIINPNDPWLFSMQYLTINKDNQVRFVDIPVWEYQLHNLQVGDQVTIEYALYFPFFVNWNRLLNARLFFHSDIPKKEFTFKFSHSSLLEFDINYYLVSPKIDSTGNIINYVFKFTNMPGCLLEPGGRPYKDLPWFSFSPKPYEMLYMHYNSFEEEFVPFWYILATEREVKIKKARHDNKIGLRNKDHYGFAKLAKKFQSYAPDDTTGLNWLRYFQAWMADTVKYKCDSIYYKDMENYKLDHPGIELSAGLLKDHNIESTYANMIFHMGLDLFTVYPVDKRFGEMSPTYFLTVHDNDFLYSAILNDSSNVFIYPKSDISNYYCNELPFYFENVPSAVIHTYDYAGYRRNYDNNMYITRTPVSSARDNVRKIYSIVNVNTSNHSLSFETRVNLSGQFSTLTRNVYTNKNCDSTINPIYLDKIYNIADNVKIIKINAGKPKIYFPYSTTVNLSYETNDLITENDQGQFTVSINYWFKHPYNKNLNPHFRFTDYYPDFLFSDTFVYMLKFDQPIKMTTNVNDISINNMFAFYSFSIKQTSPEQYMITSYLLIKSPKVCKTNIMEVAEIFDAIENVNRLKISFQK